MKSVTQFGILGLAWNYAYHGGEFSAYEMTAFKRTIGLFGIISSFIFIVMFAAHLVKLIETSKKLKDEGETLRHGDIAIYKLSKAVKDKFTLMKWLTIFAAISGFISMILSTLVNEGFLPDTSETVAAIMTFIFALGGTAITLAITIGIMIVQWPTTKNPKGGKSNSEVIEDQKIYNIFAPEPIYGIIMTIFYLIPLLSIPLTEVDDSIQVQKLLAAQTGNR